MSEQESKTASTPSSVPGLSEAERTQLKEKLLALASGIGRTNPLAETAGESWNPACTCGW